MLVCVCVCVHVRTRHACAHRMCLIWPIEKRKHSFPLPTHCCLVVRGEADKQIVLKKAERAEGTTKEGPTPGGLLGTWSGNVCRLLPRKVIYLRKWHLSWIEWRTAGEQAWGRKTLSLVRMPGTLCVELLSLPAGQKKATGGSSPPPPHPPPPPHLTEHWEGKAHTANTYKNLIKQKKFSGLLHDKLIFGIK